MDRRRFLMVSALSPVAAMAVSSGTAFAANTPSPGGHSFSFAPDGSAFLLDGEPFQIRSGEMHPARIPVPYWRHRVRMAKAMGMNTVSLYVMWNYVEERPGVFDFRTDRRDVASFIRICQEEGMWVLLRPGPYVCGEWDLGGIPPYLLRYPDIKLRVRAADDPHYMAAARRYIRELARIVRPLLVANGGPVLMVQVENEYGSYGNDATYLAEVRQAWIDAGVDGPFYTEDGLGQVEANHTNVPGGAVALSGGDAPSVAQARTAFPSVPAMAGEVYPGWLTHWGDDGFQGADTDISGTLKGLMDGKLSFNLYMIHGGTSFGFFAGANADDLSGDYQPDITSYDYCAPVTEQGAKGPRYDAYRDLIGGYLSVPPPAVPDPVPTLAGPSVTPRPYASLWDNLPPALPAADTVNPQPFETYGQNSGFVLYRRRLADYAGGALDIRWVHDYATVFVNGAYAGGFSRPRIPDALASTLNVTNGNAPLTLPTGQAPDPVLDILVEGMGRTNYGHALVDRKGILESVTLAGGDPLTGWETRLLPMDERFVRGLRPKVSDPHRPGLFFRATLDLKEPADTYLDLSGWTKGVVWVNGTNLGRYWQLGPQHRLYCPAPWLRRGSNEILVFDLHRTEPKPIGLTSTLG
ncbi:beta-galactosidase [Streptomyces sp. PTM05]|uniref:Beta-galactosidase n=1 Tax=Streptantibioticus parmotrematis TaxID=2873249 RepID=A0ABS7QYZ0_9ACTN|nr:beta-galactosidase [Streptantibioticus parmotrematis]MBY8888432.1 beta-galactosidase [Streptantibioticus parmotrematis]